MNEYDITGAFQDIEMTLIQSMQRNLKRHIAEEVEEGINWTQWQSEMLRGLTEYRLNNKKMIQDYYLDIGAEIDEYIEMASKLGASDAEIEILRQIDKGYIPKGRGRKGAAYGDFFKINQNKLNALIKATTGDLEKAEHAILRKQDDIYRQTLFKAQMYYNTGAGTMWQAVDMATKDFLAGGFNCIEYKNGAHVNIASYAEMALRTANKRANLMGQAETREKWGIHTVKISAHNSACPLCIEWQGRVYIDDVYGMGTPEEATKTGYPLLSMAIAGGMFHPNCKNGCSTYYEGINREPIEPTEGEIKEMNRRYALQQQQRYYERNYRKYQRLANGSLDEDNVRRYAAAADGYRQKLDALIANNKDVLRLERERLSLRGVLTVDARGRIKYTPKTDTNTWSNFTRQDRKFNNKVEMIQYLQDMHNIKFNDNEVMPMDAELLEGCINWLDAFTQKFAAFDRANELRVPEVNIRTNRDMDDSVGYYRYYVSSREPIEIALNREYFRTKKEARAYVERCIKSKWTVANAKEIKTFIHEYGHHVSNSLCKIYGDDWQDKFLAECIAEFKQSNPNYTYQTTAGLSDYLSRYGASKNCECFAEAFAEYFGGDNPREFATIFGRKLEKILGGF